MKVLLINPPTKMYGDWDLSALDTYTPPLGIMHIASYIQKHGHEASILDLQPINWDLGKMRWMNMEKHKIISVDSEIVETWNMNPMKLSPSIGILVNEKV